MLNDSRARQGQDRLKVDGIAGPKTNAAIEEYQRCHALPTDGKIDIHGPTLNHLLKAFTNSIASGLVDLGSLPGLQQGPATELTSNDLQAAVERFNLKTGS